MTGRVVLTLVAICLVATGGSTVVVADTVAAESTLQQPPADRLAAGDATVPVGPVVGPAAPNAQQPQPAPLLQEPPETDATVTDIQVLANGTAEWTLTIRMQLDSEAAEAEFDAFRTEFEANRSTYLDSYRDRMMGVVTNAETVTGREMNATGFDVEVGTEAVPRQWGYVTYRFHWEGFAAVEDGAVLVGDVFEGGLFLEENDILVVHAPEGHEPGAVDPSPDEMDSGELRWNGPASFGDSRPTARFTPLNGDSGDGPDDAPAADSDPEPNPDPGEGGLPWLWIGLVVLGAAGAAVLAAAYHRRRQQSGSGDSPAATSADDGSSTAGGPAGATSGGGPEESAGTDTATVSDTGDVAELVTDEHRVIETLEAEGGRMRQSDLADQLDWSASKTSRVLSGMTEEGTVQKLRIGRENVIDLENDDQSRG